MIDYVSIGKNIRKHRRRLGLTQEVLSEQVSISIPPLSRIDTGSANPSLQYLVDICNALDITIDNLMQESLPAAKYTVQGRLGALLAGCSVEEMDMLAEVAEVILRTTRNQ